MSLVKSKVSREKREREAVSSMEESKETTNRICVSKQLRIRREQESLLLCLSFQVGVSEANYNAGLVYIIVYAYFYLFKLSHYF